MKINFEKQNLIPAIIQDTNTKQVLMLGYMNEEAYLKTKQEGRVTFYSRSKERLWTKGETSGNYLIVGEVFADCDQDTILIMVQPQGSACHRNTTSCFDNDYTASCLHSLEKVISDKIDRNEEGSYTNELYKRGINKVAQKVGEEAVELIIEAKDNDEDLFKNEAADLLYHFLVLLKSKGLKLVDVENILNKRKK